MSSSLTAAETNRLNKYDPALQKADLAGLMDKALRNQEEAKFVKEADDGAAATATSETVFFENTSGRDRTIVAAKYIPSAALTANDTNYATLLLDKRLSSDYGTAVNVATETTETTGSGGSGNWTAFTPVTLGALAQTVLENGALLTVEITKTGTGVIVPAGVLVVELD